MLFAATSMPQLHAKNISQLHQRKKLIVHGAALPNEKTSSHIVAIHTDIAQL